MSPRVFPRGMTANPSAGACGRFWKRRRKSTTSAPWMIILGTNNSRLTKAKIANLE